jgi:hypothetical protein
LTQIKNILELYYNKNFGGNNMNNKKIWIPNMNIEDVFSFSNDCLNRCESKKILTNNDISIFHVYQSSRDWPLNNMIEISNFFKFSKSDQPEKNRAREIILKLLSAVSKAHFYFDSEAIVRNEPYVFSIPDFFKSGQFNYGLVYHIERNNKIHTLLVAEWDIAISGSSVVKIQPWEKHTTIVNFDKDEIFNLTKIKKIKSMDSYNYFLIKDWKSRKEYQEKVKLIENISDFKFGKILNGDHNLNKIYSSISYIEWAAGIKKWFLPKGSDYVLTLNYIENIKGKLNK